jgi:deoxyribose-phosphate aldolase
LTKEKLASLIDHTELKPHVLTKKIHSLCDEAQTHGFASICINSCWVKEAANYIKSRKYDVKICCVVGFPLGQSATEVKAFETKHARKLGADEIDMVINVGKVRELTSSSGKDREIFRNFILKDIESVVKAADGGVVKVILETGYLLDGEIVEVCKISEEAGADFVKTSTGFGPMGAFPSHLILMRKTVGNRLGVKAAGGITNFLEAIRAIWAAAPTKSLRKPSKFRIGASAGINIINTLDWAKYTDSWFIEEIPCKICPSNYVSKQPIEIQNEYVKKCKNCEYNQFRKFKDF